MVDHIEGLMVDLPDGLGFLDMSQTGYSIEGVSNQADSKGRMKNKVLLQLRDSNGDEWFMAITVASREYWEGLLK